MPTFTTYSQADFPDVFKWQAIAFMRCEWPSIFEGSLTYLSETYPPEMKPIHFVAIHGETLVSYAAILRLSLHHADQPFTVYGFGNMFTFPPYRGHGYGKQILALATDYILNSDVDVGILFCDTTLAPFYAQSDWQRTLSPTRIGQPQRFEPEEQVLRMMCFVSLHGRGYRQAFEEEPVYVEWTW